MGCGCGKSFSQTYATGTRRATISHVPTRQPTPVSIQSKSLQAKTSKSNVQTSVNTSTQPRRRV